ncbi:MAG TPA: AMP-binding protein [Actinomycetota bacterium]|nr:AMP-binding protein [Actinomycetota bacterium]
MSRQHNLALLAEEALERHGDYDSLFFEGTWYRSEDVAARARRLAGGLVELGLEPGDRVVVMMPNAPEVPIVYHALWRAGAAITPAIFLLPPDELHHVIADSEAKAIVTSPEFLPTVTSACEGVDTLKWIINVGDETDGVLALSSLEDAAEIPIVDRHDDDLAALMYTGGTTGRAKGVMLSHENLYFAGQSAQKASHAPGLTRTIVPLPLAHSFGLIVTVVGLHREEPHVAILQRWFDAANWIELVEEHRAQQSTVVPTMLQILLGLPLEDHDLSSLEDIVSGASPLPLEVAQEFERRVPSVKIREGYGLSETSASCSVNPLGEGRTGSVGKMIPGFDVRIVDEDDNDVAAGEIGEVLIRGKGVMLGYWRSPEATADSIRDGWFYTGDLGKVDEDGYLYIVDRKKDLIIRGGFNVYPRDIEDALTAHPAVSVAGVVGKPDPVKGEEVVAFVQLAAGAEATPGEIVEFSKTKLGAYKYPREVRIVDQVPLTSVLKIDRKKLRTLL